MAELPAKLDLDMYAGDGFAQDLTFVNDDDTPVDLTGATVTAVYRRNSQSTSSLSFSVLVTDDEAGEVTISLTGAQTATLGPKGVWDIQMDTGATEPRTLARGNVLVTPDVTRA